jgi:antitoxin ParD1/3/4
MSALVSLPIFAKHAKLPGMGTMNISLPDSMKNFIDEQVAEKGYGTSSEYVRDLIRREQDREKLRALLIEGLESGPGQLVDAAYFDGLRERIRRRAAGRAKAAPMKAAARPRRRTKAAGAR